MPGDGERPDELRVPFIFVPHGHPEPKEWMARHPGWVKFPAVMVPRVKPDAQPAWLPAVPESMLASLPMQGPVAEVAAVPQPPPAPEPLIDGMTAEARERYAARNDDPIAAYLAINRYIESVIGLGPRPAGQPATPSAAIMASIAPAGIDPSSVTAATGGVVGQAADAFDPIDPGAGADPSVQSGRSPGNGGWREAQYIPPDAMRHVLSAHGAGSNSIRPDAGQFYPEYSKPTALQDLANLIYLGAGPPNIGSARYGRIAVQGQVFDKVTYSDGRTAMIPHPVRTTTPGGRPTNNVIMIMEPNGDVVTMYPADPVTLFQGGQE